MNGNKNEAMFPYFTLYKLFSFIFFLPIPMMIFIRNKFDLYLILTSFPKLKSKMTIIDFLLTYNFFIVIILCVYKRIAIFIGGNYYYSYFKFNFSYLFQILLFSSLALLNIFNASRSFFVVFPILLLVMILSFISHFLASLFYQLQTSIKAKYHIRLLSFNIFFVVILTRFFIFLKKVIYVTNDIYANIYLFALFNSIFTILSSIVMHILYLYDIENFGNSFKTVRYCFNLHSLNISIELFLAAISFFSFIIGDLHLKLFIPKNISIQLPLEHFRMLHNSKSYLSNFYYYMSPVYYFSSNANTIIELVSQKQSLKPLSYFKSKSNNSPSTSSRFISLFQEMQKIPFVAKIATVPISNPSSSIPFVVSSEPDPFNNYFSINSIIKSFRNSPNFFRFYFKHLNSTIYTDDSSDSTYDQKSNETIKLNVNEITIYGEYEDDKDQKICKVLESFFAFNPLESRFTQVNESEFKTKKINKINQKSKHLKSDILYINFLFYSNFVSSFTTKNSNGIFYEINNIVNFEIVIIITVLFYIGLRLYLLISNCINYRETQKAWKSLILLPNASTIDLLRCQQTCIICRNKMTTKTAKRLRCHHCIHLTCLIKWTKLRNRCPLCQEEIIMSQDGNGHYSYFYSYNHHIFNHSIKRKNKINSFDNFIDFITGKNNNNVQNLPLNDNDGIGRNSDEDEQNVSPYFLFYVCSLRKFRFLRRHLVIINKKCSSNVSYFIEKKKNELSMNKYDNKSIGSEDKNIEINGIIINKKSKLFHLLNGNCGNSANIKNNIANDKTENVDATVNNEIENDDVNDPNEIDNKINANNDNNDINLDEENNINNNDGGIMNNNNNDEIEAIDFNLNNRMINNNININNNNDNEIEVIDLDETNINNNNDAVINNDANLIFDNSNIFTYLNESGFQACTNDLIMNSLISNNDEIDEEMAARKLVSQYKERFEFDRALLDIVCKEMQANLPFLLKEESFLANQQKELQKIRDISKEEIEEINHIAQKVSSLIRKYRAALKEIEDQMPWTVFNNPFDEIQ